MSGSRYAALGVDLGGAERTKQRIGEAVRGARTALSVGAVGGFGGMVRVPEGYLRPVLVMSTDGVGTKVMVARQAGVFDTLGEDLVHHAVNDILVHGATPLAFLDYIAGAGLTEDQITGLVAGVARACREHAMALAGGETAQMPDLYAAGDFDLAGTIVGVVEEDAALHGDRVVPGDVLLGYESTGLHTNGYTLARKVLLDTLGLPLAARPPELGMTIGEALLAVHRSYRAAVAPVLSRVHGLAHITGGGIPGNLARVLPEGCQAVVESGSWDWPPLFRLLQRAGDVSLDEMREVFNLGVGFLAVLPPGEVEAAARAAAAAGVRTWIMGEVRKGRGGEGGERGVRFV